MPFKHLTAESNIELNPRKYTIIWISRWYITQNRKCISTHVIIVSFNIISNHYSINYKSCTGESSILHLKKTPEFKTRVCPSLVWIKISKHEPFEKDTGGLGFLLISELTLLKYCLTEVIEYMYLEIFYIYTGI